MYFRRPILEEMMMPIDSYSDALEIAAAIERGDTSAVQILQSAERAHEKNDESWQAYKTWAPEMARNMALAVDTAIQSGWTPGPLCGVPISVKDLFGVPGMPLFAGTPRELPEQWRAEGPVVAAARRAGAVFVGKSHTVELAFGGLGSNPHWGTPCNPWDPDHHRVPGGSSAGAGVSLCAGSATIALGTDTAGSIRIPASMTGNVGLKTTAGRWSLDGIVPLSPTLDTAGVLARCVPDITTAFFALDAVEEGTIREPLRIPDSLSGLTLGIAGGGMWQDCAPGIAEAVDAAMGELQNAGARVIDVDLPEVSESVDLLRCGNVVSAECDLFLEEVLVGWRQRLDPIIASRIADGGAISAREFLQRKSRLSRLKLSAARRFSCVDFLVSPTVANTPPKVADIQTLDGYRRENFAALRNTCVVNNLGLCAITLPVGLDAARMPVGMQIMAPAFHETKVLMWAGAIEKILGRPDQRLGRPARRND